MPFNNKSDSSSPENYSDESASQPNSSQTSGKQKDNQSFNIQIPSISLPKGGGALKGIDEKFQVNAANGTTVFNLPLPFSKSRSAFGPSLGLSYNSGAGNSVFGLGWSCDVPCIQRKTDKKLPQYRDKEESDTFLFAGAEDLVPFLTQQGDDWIGDDVTAEVKRYRPRVEGLFARIEKIEKDDSLYWKVTTKENVVTFFGRTELTRISDPNITDPKDYSRIFKWLPDFSYDDKGNCMEFEYVEEDLANVPLQVNEKNRLNGIALFTNKYLKRIKYGNKNPFYADKDSPYNPASPSSPEYFFETVFDYDDHEDAIPSTEVQQDWSCRTDPFSDCKAGFEIRIYRLCRRILFFHNFIELDGEPTLVRSLNFSYKHFKNSTEENTEADYIIAIEQTGYKGNVNDGYDSKSLPKLEFTYNEWEWNTNPEVQHVSEENLIHAPVGIGNNYQWTDFFGEGISGILTEQADTWYYKSNLGDGDFSIAQPVMTKPSLNGLSSGLLQLQDVEADGRKFIVSTDKALNGYYEQTDEGDWYPFKPFENSVNIDLQNDNIKFLDLNGDGIPELVLSEECVFTWYASKGTEGFEEAMHSAKPFDEELGPALIFADQQQRIYLADMNGDGLTDIVRIKNGEVCYWSNLGYGNFGAKVTMDKAPVFDSAEDFNPAYLHLFDVSGTGVTDLVYLGKNSFKAFFNLSGNGWSDANEIENFPSVELPNTVNVMDFLGNGTGCIVWSSPLPGNSGTAMRYIDLMGGIKPYIVSSYKNNFGKQTTVEYKNSTKFYLEDKLNGTPWITKLPFPVQCVSKLEITEDVTGVRFTNQYSYHHGYYDHAEREFRGFGRVEQTDTEFFDDYKMNTNPDGSHQIVDADFYQPPVLTKTWYHTGAFLDSNKILTQFKSEYFANEYELPDAVLDDAWTVQEWREALRACKGIVLRQEVYAPDGSDKQNNPYSVASHNCNIQMLQPVDESPHAVFLVTESEAITYSYERNTADPRIAHSLNIVIDTYGNILESAAVVYGRKDGIEAELPGDLALDTDTVKLVNDEQHKIHIIYSKNNFTNSFEEDYAYRLPVAYENISYELTGLPLSSGNEYFLPSDFQDVFVTEKEKTAGKKGAVEISYQSAADGSFQIRKIEHVRILFQNDLTTVVLPLGTIESLGLGYESYKFAFTTSMLEDIFVGLDINTPLTEAGYFHFADDADGANEFWIRSGTAVFPADPATHFYLPDKFIDPLGSETTITFYKNSDGINYHLLISETEDALHNKVAVEKYDFRFLAPQKMIDINGSASEVAFDILGLVAGMAVSGKNGEGDNLDGFVADLEPDDIGKFFSDPQYLVETETFASLILGNATARFVYDFTRTAVSTAAVAGIVREKHLHQLTGAEESKLQMSFEYTDGFGKVAMKKVQAEPGEIRQLKDTGGFEYVSINPRWVGNGRTVLNNKGKPVKQYEPYFSGTHEYETENEIVVCGVTPLLYYDPLGRLIKTVLPDGTFSKVEFDGWFQKTFDGNDTVLEVDNAWYAEKSTGTDEEKDAAEKAKAHYNTPATIHLDSLGRSFYSIAHNVFTDSAGGEHIEFYGSYTELDIENNPRKLVDARGNAVMQYKYDMLGNVIYQQSMDAGERWLLNDCMNNPLYKWDSKETVFHFLYDEIHRPTLVEVTEKDTATIVARRMEYGETHASPTNYLRGKVVKAYDGAGIVTSGSYDFEKEEFDLNGGYDFKGNPLISSRQLCGEYKNTIDWTDESLVSIYGDPYTTQTEYDALNRPIRIITPDVSEFTPLYNEASLLETMTVNIRGTKVHEFVSDINYNEKGQRVDISYGNGTKTSYEYDEKTFRISRILTTRKVDDKIENLQDLNYTYDCVGNITMIKDAAQKKVFFNNSEIEANGDYTYDAVYRLIKATGREHAGGNLPVSEYDHHRMFQTVIPTDDDSALQNYQQCYEYDAVGNMMRMIHNAGVAPFANRWTRTFEYEETNNLLKTTQVGADLPDSYVFDVHGNMLTMPHLKALNWNFEDHLQSIERSSSNAETNFNKAYYVYDGSGNRVRKVITYGNSVTEERIYLGALEIFTQSSGDSISVRRETLHVMDDKRRIAMVDTKTIDDNAEVEESLIRYQYDNHLGTACIELDDDANIISYEEYYPFGSTTYQCVTTDIEVPPKRYRYTGKERDEESGLYYHGARYYAPWLARWTAADPIGVGDGWNIYQIVKSNPINRIDRSGNASPGIAEIEHERNEHEQWLRDPNSPGHLAIQSIGDGDIMGGSGAATLGAMITHYFVLHDAEPTPEDAAALAMSFKGAVYHYVNTQQQLRTQTKLPNTPDVDDVRSASPPSNQVSQVGPSNTEDQYRTSPSVSLPPPPPPPPPSEPTTPSPSGPPPPLGEPVIGEPPSPNGKTTALQRPAKLSSAGNLLYLKPTVTKNGTQVNRWMRADPESPSGTGSPPKLQLGRALDEAAKDTATTYGLSTDVRTPLPGMTTPTGEQSTVIWDAGLPWVDDTVSTNYDFKLSAQAPLTDNQSAYINMFGYGNVEILYPGNSWLFQPTGYENGECH